MAAAVFVPCMMDVCHPSFASCFLGVQRVEPWNKDYQYLLFAAEPYEIISFRVSQDTDARYSDTVTLC